MFWTYDDDGSNDMTFDGQNPNAYSWKLMWACELDPAELNDDFGSDTVWGLLGSGIGWLFKPTSTRTECLEIASHLIWL